jgi:hypothetical protein
VDWLFLDGFAILVDFLFELGVLDSLGKWEEEG